MNVCPDCARYREAVRALFDEFVRDPAVRQAMARVPWGGFRDKVLAALEG